MSVNKAMLVGRVGKDPEIRVIPEKTTVATFPVATNWHKKNNQGDRIQETEWHHIVAYNQIAENCRDYLNKGQLVFIEGRIKTRSWEDKDGARHWRTEIMAETMRMLGGRKENGESEYNNSSSSTSADPSADIGKAPF
ncbi:single-stranded DNA-binding protein [Thermodesulfobacteriota bacterium]